MLKKWCYFLLVGMVLYVSIIAYKGVLAAGKKMTTACKECHEKVYEKTVNSRYQHVPAIEGKCEKCHLFGILLDYPDEETAQTGDVKTSEIARYYDEAMSKEHFMLIRGIDEHTVYSLRIRSKAKGGCESVVNTGVLELERVRKNMPQDKVPPKIFNVSKPRVTKGLFLQAEVKWETDEPANGRVEYGKTEKYGMVTSTEGTWRKKHRVVLLPLAKDSQYHFRIVCEDIFGNIASSAHYTLSTKSAADAALPEENKVFEKAEQEPTQIFVPPHIRNTSLAYFSGGLLVVQWETDMWADTGVEVTREARKVATEDSKLPVQVHEQGLVDARDSGIKACYRCHPKNILGLSHPVDIPLREDMNPGEDIPIARTRIIICVSCHQPHGSNYAYLGRKKDQEELCIECHGAHF